MLGAERADAGLVTVKLVGDVASVTAAVNAGAAAATRVGQVVAVHVIPRPHEDLAVIVDDEGPDTLVGGERLDIAHLQQLKVVELRAVARGLADFPIKGRDIARAGRDELLATFRTRHSP